jgi:glutamate carboxypeptidase
VEQFDRAKQKMRAIVATSLPHTKAEITFDDGYPPLAPAPETSGCSCSTTVRARTSVSAVSRPSTPIARARRTCRRRHVRADDHRRHRAQGPRRPFGEETADLTTLPVQAKRAAVTMLRLFK